MPSRFPLGLDLESLAPDDAERGRVFMFRPYLKLEICASVVPHAEIDMDRQFLFRCGIGPDGNAAVLRVYKDQEWVEYVGEAPISTARATDSLHGQSATLRAPLAGLWSQLVPLLRPMDRVRLSLVTTGAEDWLLFDGFLRTVRSSRRSGQGWSASVNLTCAGLEYLLSAAIFNWQGMVHAASDILNSPGPMLMDAIGKAAEAPHVIAKKFLLSAIHTTMGLRIGDFGADAGLAIIDYMGFADKEPGQWASWDKVAYPIPWQLIQAASGSSLWGIIQQVSEPVLHEFFVSYRSPDPAATPTLLLPRLVHRIRPFPGKKAYDSTWLSLPVVKVGASAGVSINAIDEQLSGDHRPNCFHWQGLGIGDHSKEAFEAKLFWGWVTSDSLVNRYGYVSVGVTSRLSPILPGSDATDYLKFAKDHLFHYAAQEVVLPLLRTRSIDGPFIPVRPGQVIEDHSLGSDTANIVTGYCTAVDFTLQASGDGVTMGMGATVERCLRGTDAAGYPDAVRALVPDLEFRSYAGEGVGEPGPWPAVLPSGISVNPATGKATVAGNDLDPDLLLTIKEAATRQQVPAWLIAHILHNETAFGKFWGAAEDPHSVAVARTKGIGQITDVAVSDLLADGYTNPDGTPFSSADRPDNVKGIHATARLLKLNQGYIEAMPSGFPPDGQSYYSWVARAYRWGAGATRTAAYSTNWSWPVPGDLSMPDYVRYWSPAGVESGRLKWGVLG